MSLVRPSSLKIELLLSNAYHALVVNMNASDPDEGVEEHRSRPDEPSIVLDTDINIRHRTNLLHHTDHNETNTIHCATHSALQTPSNYQPDTHDPNLHDTEELFEDLNMASPRSGVSEASERWSNAAKSDLTLDRNRSPSRPQSKRSSQHLQSTPQPGSFKRPKTGSSISRINQLTPSSSRLQSKDTTNITTPSNGRAKDRPFRPSSSEGVTEAEVTSSFEMDEVATKVSRPYRIRDDPTEPFVAAEMDQEWKQAHPEQADHSKEALVEYCSKPHASGLPPIDANTGPNLNTHTDPYVNLVPFELETPIPLGVLVPTEGSIPTVPAITITNRVTTFGRDPERNTFAHPGDVDTPNWERVGRNCIDLTFWYRNIEKEIDSKTLPPNWHENPKLVCLISTRTSRYILVNGVKLTKGTRCWNYGKLRTGDIITIVHPDLHREPKHAYETQSLSFRCEFHTGKSKASRPADGSAPFETKVEVDEYDKSQDRIVNGWGRGIERRSREDKIAQGIDPDVEVAERRAAHHERTRPARELAEREEADFDVLLDQKREEFAAKTDRTPREHASLRALENIQQQKAKEQREILEASSSAATTTATKGRRQRK